MMKPETYETTAFATTSRRTEQVTREQRVKDKEIEIPKNTYASVPMQIIHSGNIPKFVDMKWSGEYFLFPLPIHTPSLKKKLVHR